VFDLLRLKYVGHFPMHELDVRACWSIRRFGSLLHSQNVTHVEKIPNTILIV